MLDPVWQFAVEFAMVLATMAPYLLLGFFMAGLLSVLISPSLVERHLGGQGIWPVVKASLLGVPLPLCSCGVIPVSASLRRHGASKAATVGFLISTPQTGVDSIAVTYSLMGGVFAVFRPIAALVSGIVGGLAIILFGRQEGNSQAAPPVAAQDAACHVDSGGVSGGTETTEPRGRLWRIFHHGFVELPQDIGKSLLVGLLIAAVIAVIIPDDFFASRLGGFFAGGIGAMLVMMALGIPIYVCATASVAMAMELLAKGVSPGAVLVFLMTGPATNAASLAMIWKVMGRRTAVIYLVSVAATALASGFALDAVFQLTGLSPNLATHHHHSMDSIAAWEWASTVVLAAVLAMALLGPYLRKPASAAKAAAGGPAMEKQKLGISGMTCSHCVESVRRALLASPGVQSAEVSLAAQEAVVSGNKLDLVKLRQAVEGAGYHVKELA